MHVIPLASPAPGTSLWWATREADPSLAAALLGSLSPAEHRRAARFGSEELRLRYVVGRGTLRHLLAQRLGMAASDVPIVSGRRGRPQLDGIALDFNVSHTRDVMLVAVAEDAIAGVDVEHAARRINVPGIARRCLSQAERDALGALGADEARRDVLRLWTCKEAMSKATGDGLAAPFRELDVAVGARRTPARTAALPQEVPPPAQARLSLELRHGPSPYVPSHWRLHAVAVPEGYLATLALWRAG